MEQLLYNFVNWQYFGVFVVVWGAIDIIWIGQWKGLIKRIGQLLSKPWIFTKDEYPEEPSLLYPRTFLEQVSLTGKHKDKTELDTQDKISAGSEWLYYQKKRIFNPVYPMRTFGYLISLALFVFFILANTITIANTMVLMALMGDLSPLLQRLDLAILGGALFSAIVGLWMLIEMSGNDAELINLDTLNNAQKRIYKMIALITIIFSMMVMVALSIQRLVSLGVLEASSTTDIILSFILHGLLAINNSFAAALTFSPAASGAIIVIYLSVMLVTGLFPVFVFFVDVLWRTTFIVLDILVWALFTPIIVIPYGIGKVFSLFFAH